MSLSSRNGPKHFKLFSLVRATEKALRLARRGKKFDGTVKQPKLCQISLRNLSTETHLSHCWGWPLSSQVLSPARWGSCWRTSSSGESVAASDSSHTTPGPWDTLGTHAQSQQGADFKNRQTIKKTFASHNLFYKRLLTVFCVGIHPICVRAWSSPGIIISPGEGCIQQTQEYNSWIEKKMQNHNIKWCQSRNSFNSDHIWAVFNHIWPHLSWWTWLRMTSEEAEVNCRLKVDTFIYVYHQLFPLGFHLTPPFLPLYYLYITCNPIPLWGDTRRHTPRCVL